MPGSYPGTQCLPTLVSSGLLTTQSANGAFRALNFSRRLSTVGIRSTSKATLLQGVQMEKIDPVLLEAAIRVFGNESLAMHWLMTPSRALVDKRPVDATTEDALELLARLEHGLGA